jgi:hypothetical protein
MRMRSRRNDEIGMTNYETRMTNQIRMMNVQMTKRQPVGSASADRGRNWVGTPSTAIASAEADPTSSPLCFDIRYLNIRI